jgi:hypothetical protein
MPFSQLKNSIRNSVLFTFVILCNFIGGSTLAAVNQNKLKAALVINISKHIEWPQTENDTFTIAVYQDKVFFDLLKKLNGIKHKNKVLTSVA